MLGVLIAKFMHRAVYLPSMRVNSTLSISFSSMYTVEALKTTLANHHIQMLDSEPPMAPGGTQVVGCGEISVGSGSCLEKIKSKFFKSTHVALSCPYPSAYVPPSYVTSNKRLFWEVMEALHPTQEIEILLEGVKKSIHPFAHEAGIGYTQGMDSISDSQPLLEFNGFQDFDFIWSTSERSLSFKDNLGRPLQNFSFPEETLDVKFSKMLDFYIGLSSSKSIANANTTFGALLFLERRHNRHYSAGFSVHASALLHRLPILELPWVFFHDSSDQVAEYMLKVAVKSARMTHALHPVCILVGEETPIYHWLLEHNITVILHRPHWTGRFHENARIYWEKNKDFQLTKQLEPEKLKNALQIEIPLIDGLRQFDYLLYTTATVVFRGRLTLDTFGTSHPPIIQGRPDDVLKFPFGSSVVLWNVAGGLVNYDTLVAYVEDQHRKANALTLVTNGLNMSLLDIQQNWVISDEIVSEAFRGYDGSLALVDFYGMTPQDFAHSVRSKTCPHKICLNGIFRGWCQFIFEVFVLLEQDDLQFGLPVMQECYNKNCLFRGGCRKWKEAISLALQP